MCIFREGISFSLVLSEQMYPLHRLELKFFVKDQNFPQEEASVSARQGGRTSTGHTGEKEGGRDSSSQSQLLGIRIHFPSETRLETEFGP